MLVDEVTGRAQLGRGEPRGNMLYNCARLRCHVMQRLHEGAKAQVRHLAPPQRFHALKVQGLQADGVVRGTQVVGQFPMKSMAHVGHLLVHAGQVLLGPCPIRRPLPFARQGAVGCRKCSQCLSERLGGVLLAAVSAREIRGQPKVKACAFTCHDSADGLRHDDAREVHIQIAQGIPLDGHRLDGAFKVARPGKLVDRGADTQAIAAQQLPACLRQGERFGMADVAKGGRPTRCAVLPACRARTFWKKRW